jgi:fibrillarin-like pre-rRNA processing protein
MRPLGAKFPGIFEDLKARRRFIFTRNAVPGRQVYGEALVRDGGAEYREWNPTRSKLCAALMKEISQIGIKEGDVVLYLGASTGTTISHVSDMIGPEGIVFGVDIAPRVLRELVFLSEERKNIAPILCDAGDVVALARYVSQADVVFMDVSQKNQEEIFIKNCRAFLKPGGFGLLALKARSVDVTKPPREVYKRVRAELEKHLIVADYRELDPFEKDHAFFVCKKPL